MLIVFRREFMNDEYTVTESGNNENLLDIIYEIIISEISEEI